MNNNQQKKLSGYERSDTQPTAHDNGLPGDEATQHINPLTAGAAYIRVFIFY